jgi:hypothetical protein
VFVPALDQVPDEYEVEGPDPNYWVLTLLAVSEDELRDVAVRTLLIPFIRDDTEVHELKFEIVIAGDEADEVFVTQDRYMARGYLPAEVVPLVMPCVCGAIGALAGAVQPAVIYRVTKATQPPDKALRKHQIVTERLVELGFQVQDSGTDEFGRQFWVMTQVREDGYGQE